MAINAISTAASQGAANTNPVNPSSVLKKDDFLKMLVAQLSNQDPISPVDSKEFLSQNVQFTTVEKLENIESLLTQSQNSQKGMERVLAAGYLGQEVTAMVPPKNKDEIATSTTGIVVGMNFAGNTPELVLGNGQRVSMNNVTGVKLPGA